VLAPSTKGDSMHPETILVEVHAHLMLAKKHIQDASDKVATHENVLKILNDMPFWRGWVSNDPIVVKTLREEVEVLLSKMRRLLESFSGSPRILGHLTVATGFLQLAMAQAAEIKVEEVQLTDIHKELAGYRRDIPLRN